MNYCSNLTFHVPAKHQLFICTLLLFCLCDASLFRWNSASLPDLRIELSYIHYTTVSKDISGVFFEPWYSTSVGFWHLVFHVKFVPVSVIFVFHRLSRENWMHLAALTRHRAGFCEDIRKSEYEPSCNHEIFITFWKAEDYKSEDDYNNLSSH